MNDRTLKRSLVVAGCGRSGTAYTARVLQRAGLRCGHEQVFTGREHDTIRTPMADSSWLAVPFLGRLPENSLVLHQVRDPLLVTSSYVSEGFFRQRPYERPLWKHVAKRALHWPASGQYRLIQLVQRTLPHIWSEPTAERRAARFWIEWNELVRTECSDHGLERRQYRVEDIDAAWLRSTLGSVSSGSSSDVESLLGDVPTTTNSRPRPHVMRLEALGSLAGDFVRAAQRCGYRLDVD